MQAQDHLTERGLAAAGLADDGEDDRLARVDVQRHVVDSDELFAHQHAADAEDLADALDFEQLFGHVTSPPVRADGRPQSGRA